ncbi:DNA polymerase domain-containing protein [Gordonia zhaorongruii]|uniref:DNA polymerase domain-containing protein n=1 Tax=Gordonia zhaorongruii TaxID=2597659 RepID=UPI00117D6496|nr:DNA primase small subunit domain-containing protein [Gordonia zhaorongruii]
MGSDAVELHVPGPAGAHRTVRLSSPDRIYFPGPGHTKLDIARYYESVSEGITRALSHRPCMLHRFPKGTTEKKVHQKKLPAGAPDWVETVDVFFPRYRRTVGELCVTEAAAVLWAVQMATVEFHPWNSRRDYTIGFHPTDPTAAPVEFPDEWRIDLDPMPECDFATVRRVAEVVHEILDELGVVGYPKTSGGRGLHVYVRIAPEWGFTDVRRAAHAFGAEVVRRTAGEATVAWWRKDRDPSAVFVDFNQNARDHTMAAAYSVRATPRATVSAPITWDELPDVEPDDFTVATMPERFARLGDLHATIDDVAHRLDTLLQWADRDDADEATGAGDD